MLDACQGFSSSKFSRKIFPSFTQVHHVVPFAVDGHQELLQLPHQEERTDLQHCEYKTCSEEPDQTCDYAPRKFALVLKLGLSSDVQCGMVGTQITWT